MPTSQVFPGPLFSPIASIDGPNPETSNHALRCRMLSGSTMAPRQHSCHSPHSTEQHGTLLFKCLRLWTPKGPSVRGPVGALLGQHC